MIQRRSFLSALGAAVAVQRSTSFQPARHTEDDWLDQLGSKHRLIFDTTTADGFGHALMFGNNFLDVNKNAYGIEYSDVGLVIVVRHDSTSLGYNDAMWAKYGKIFSQRTGVAEPKAVPSNNITQEGVAKKGMQLAICRLATRNLANRIASSMGGDGAQINEELIANILPNGHMVPAGIVAVSRAQERGYTFAHGV